MTSNGKPGGRRIMQKADSADARSEAARARARALRMTLVCAVVLGVLLSGAYFASKSGSDPQTYRNDFNVYYHASREIVGGRDPYQHSLGGWTPYLYPPFLAELVVPLALTPLPLAAYMWFLIGATSVFMAAWVSAGLADERRTAFSPARSKVALASCAILIVVRFVLDNFALGQVNPLVGALVAVHIWLFVRGKKGLSAIALVGAISIKLTPALVLVYHLAKLRFKYSAACVALLAAVTAASFAPFGSAAPNAFRAFVSRTLRNEQGYNFADAGNQSLRGLIARFNETTDAAGDGADSRTPADDLTLLLGAAMMLAAIACAVQARSELAGVAPFVCCMVLLSPLSWKAHFVLLIVPISNLFAQLKTASNGWRYLTAGSLLTSFVLFNSTSPRLIGLAAAEWADAHSLVFAGALLMFLVSIVAPLMRKFGKHPPVC